jgi:hypothetical protein
MGITFFFEQFEIGAEQRRDASTVMPLYGQPAASLGTIGGEGSKNGVTTLSYRARC